MRILFVINGLGRGGAEGSFVRDSAELVRRGHQVDMCILYGTYDAYPLAQELEPRVGRYAIGAQSAGDIHAAIRLRAHICSGSYDTVYTTLNDANMLVRFAVIGLSVRLVRREANVLTKKPLWQRVLDVLLDWRTQTIIAVSQQIADELVRLMPWKRASVYVLRNAVSLGRRVDVTCESPAIVCVGSLTPKKNHTVLIEAVIRARAQGIPMRLDIIGEGAERPQLEALIRARGAREYARLVGELPHEKVLVAYAHAQIFALPSSWEGSPNALLEAMARGLPVIASDIPSIREIVGEKAGLLVPPSDVDAWVHGMQKIANSGLRASMGLSAYERVAQEFNPVSRFDKLESLLCGH